MEDLDILKQLYHGNHLNEYELIRARKLLHSLNLELESRI